MAGPVVAAERGLKLSEALEVRDLPSEGLCYREDLPVPFVEALIGEAARRGAVRFEVLEGGTAEITIDALSPEEPPPVKVQGRVQIGLKTTCVRCLEPVRVDLSVPVEAVLFPEHDPLAGVGQANKRSPGPTVVKHDPEPLEPWSETFPHPDRLDEGAYNGLRIPLPELLTQALLIELPTDPVCADDDVCNQRTEALIEAANAEVRASDAEGDPRWAALRALRASTTAKPSGSED